MMTIQFKWKKIMNIPPQQKMSPELQFTKRHTVNTVHNIAVKKFINTYLIFLNYLKKIRKQN